MRVRLLAVILGILVWVGLAVPARAAAPKPPALPREFRAAWIATVSNIDWPSRPGLPVDQQKAELIAILDRAKSLRLNAVIFQVRPGCDALYMSTSEPWSEYLTGRMGQAPQPFYDPLAFAITEAHRRGLELHAWINPFRARHMSAKSPISENHISNRNPGLVRTYGKQLWLDPGEQATHDYSVAVILDIVRRYDVDGIHIDDYFYPYREKDAAGRDLPFPDDDSWKRYVASGGKLDRDDWRRNNVDRFVERMYREVKAAKRFVKVGISPFGIWRPNNPVGIRGFDAYASIYADSRKWLVNGWCDYLAPQLYWPLAKKEQSLPALFKWWDQQSSKGRHVWPGINSTVVGELPATEMVNQIAAIRKTKPGSGEIFWNMKSLMTNKAKLVETLQRDSFPESALVPEISWLGGRSPSAPKAVYGRSGGDTVITWESSTDSAVCWFAVQSREKGKWTTEILPATRLMWRTGRKVDAVAVSAIVRTGQASKPTVVAVP